MKNKEKNIAYKIVELEKEIQLGKNVQENTKKIEEIMLSLPLEEVIEIDHFILKQNLLTK
jgi:hypothetical protein